MKTLEESVLDLSNKFDEPCLKFCLPPLKTPAAPLLRVIALAKPVRRLGHTCFHGLLSRVLTVPRRRPVDRTFTDDEWSEWMRERGQGRRDTFPPVPNPPLEPVESHPDAVANPFWLEEQRMFLAAWSFALYRALSDNNLTEGLWQWSKADTIRLGNGPRSYRSLRETFSWDACPYHQHSDMVEVFAAPTATTRLSDLCSNDWNCCILDQVNRPEPHSASADFYDDQAHANTWQPQDRSTFIILFTKG